MDDIFGILFYIVIIVLGGIISAYRSRSKRKMKTTAPGETQEDSVRDEIPPSGYDPFEELTKKFELDVEEPIENPEVEPETAPPLDMDSLEAIADTPEDEGMAVFEETREVMQSDSEQNDAEQDNNQITISQISDQDTFDEIEKQDDINLADNIKLGIIYSEILKRKHF